MLWISINIGLYLLGLGVLFYLLGRKKAAVDKRLATNLSLARKERDTKKEVVFELGEHALGMITKADLEALDAKLAESEDSLQTGKGKITITEAELEAVDTRLRELEELKRELEVSNIDAVKELEMLRSQQREIASKNEAMRNQINESIQQIDSLIGALSESAEAVEKLTNAKNELTETEQKVQVFEDQISSIHEKYLTLKKAYDALDIEYAQLYEKQQSALD